MDDMDRLQQQLAAMERNRVAQADEQSRTGCLAFMGALWLALLAIGGLIGGWIALLQALL
jgi:hypothetical protein